MSKKIYKLDQVGLEVEIGKFARHADGAAWIRAQDNIVLATAVSAPGPKEFMGFFPLTVEYREKMAAAGKFPGGFFKREGRLSDFEVLTSRLIDRSIRPMFPEFYFNEVQVLSTVYSSDGKFPVEVLALLGSSLALVLSDIPFNAPIGAVRAVRVNGEWKFNSNQEEAKTADSILTIAGTLHGINMVEGYANKVSEDELVDLLFRAHELIKVQVNWQLEIANDLKVTKVFPESSFDWKIWKEKVSKALPADFVGMLYTSNKKERSENMDSLQEGLLNYFATQIDSKEVSKSQLMYIFELLLNEQLPESIAKRNKRVDGRALDEIRPISVEIGILPRSHGSCLFTRGETQALVSTTLGTAQDAQKMEPLIGEVIEKRFMLHYNFTPFSTGEVKAIRSVGRREIGHGYLAESSFYNTLPRKEDFPYTIRSISDILESNGSSSMASVCGTTMALMDAGVPINDMVAGIAMGLIRDEKGTFYVLSDILGIEDAMGLMDFKITGTAEGITAVQMDIKDESGLRKDVLVKALAQARVGRLHILNIMKTVSSAPRSEVSPLAPRIISYKVNPDKIGAIIGTAGKTIKEIIAQTGVQSIDIEDNGEVKIYSTSASAAEAALAFVKGLAGDVEIGAEFTGKIKRHTDFGILVDIFPGKTGLVHVSTISRAKWKELPNTHPLDSLLDVKVINYDRESGRISLIAKDLQ